MPSLYFLPVGRQLCATADFDATALLDEGLELLKGSEPPAEALGLIGLADARRIRAA